MTDHTKLDRQVLSWPGITSHEHAFGGREDRLGQREIGHYHDDLALADIPFSRKVRDDAPRAGTPWVRSPPVWPSRTMCSRIQAGSASVCARRTTSTRPSRSSNAPSSWPGHRPNVECSASAPVERRRAHDPSPGGG